MTMNLAGRAWGEVLRQRAEVNGARRREYVPGSNRILVALTHWMGDRNAAMELGTFLADLEEKHTDLADILFVHRFDCPPPDKAVLNHVSRKFNVFVHKTEPGMVGWPQGCNSIWASTVRWVRTNILLAHCPAYKAFFCCEVDGAPCIKDWLPEISKAWNEAEAKQPTYQAGPMVEHPKQHINGTCLLSCDPAFLDWAASVQESSLAGGWDYFLAGNFRKWGWANIPRMRSYYNRPHFLAGEYAAMREEKLIWVHGDKSGCLIDYGRKELL